MLQADLRFGFMAGKMRAITLRVKPMDSFLVINVCNAMKPVFSGVGNAYTLKIS